jgi:hypothetical protein
MTGGYDLGRHAAANIRHFRVLRHMRQCDLGAALGQRGQAWISQLEHGKIRLTLPDLVAIATILNVTVTDFLRENKALSLGVYCKRCISPLCSFCQECPHCHPQHERHHQGHSSYTSRRIA